MLCLTKELKASSLAWTWMNTRNLWVMSWWRTCSRMGTSLRRISSEGCHVAWPPKMGRRLPGMFTLSKCKIIKSRLPGSWLKKFKKHWFRITYLCRWCILFLLCSDSEVRIKLASIDEKSLCPACGVKPHSRLLIVQVPKHSSRLIVLLAASINLLSIPSKALNVEHQRVTTMTQHFQMTQLHNWGL